MSAKELDPKMAAPRNKSQEAPFWGGQDLRALPVEKRRQYLPVFLTQLLEQATAALPLKRIYLFGSRARGDFTPISDYDLAFEMSPKKTKEWTRFKLEREEDLRTLLSVDLVDFSSVPDDFRKKIIREGIVIYEEK